MWGRRPLDDGTAADWSNELDELSEEERPLAVRAALERAAASRRVVYEKATSRSID
ncbi:DUF4259 domain-containing protein [Actinomadura sp. NBRC 104412]|uniref:DUF4259 domain-containing protein n=1 Tax=Actinomadura sp. NBRC 104412 TaxID=3032203 RepID=UPI0033206D63